MISKKKRSSPKFRVIFRPKSKILTDDLQKKKKKKKKKRSSPKFKAIFLPKFRKFKRFRGGSFRMGGAIFNFSHKIGLKSTKNMRFCILHKPMGGARAPPPPPGYATACSLSSFCQKRYSKFTYIVLNFTATFYFETNFVRVSFQSQLFERMVFR